MLLFEIGVKWCTYGLVNAVFFLFYEFHNFFGQCYSYLHILRFYASFALVNVIYVVTNHCSLIRLNTLMCFFNINGIQECAFLYQTVSLLDIFTFTFLVVTGIDVNHNGIEVRAVICCENEKYV